MNNNGKIILLGFGISGESSADYFVKKNIEIAIVDEKDESNFKSVLNKYKNNDKVSFYFGGKMPSININDIIIKSPGIPLDHLFITEAKKKGVKVVVDLEWAFNNTDAEIISITGTNGKTTITTWISEILKLSGENSFAAGNIGVGVLEILSKANKIDSLVLEMSSFQLSSIDKFRPNIAIYTNIEPDHISWHGSFENYRDAKFNMSKNQTEDDYIIYNIEDNELSKWINSINVNKYAFSSKNKINKGMYIDKNGDIILIDNGVYLPIINKNEINLIGIHNLENAMAVALACYLKHVSLEVIADGLKKFKGVAHRTEKVAMKKGVLFVNDSKGTNPASTIKAIQAIDKKIHLILGGYDKKASFDEVFSQFGDKVISLTILGETKEQLIETANRYKFENVFKVNTLDEAVEISKRNAKSGEVVLFSPACASWDMYKNFEERGNHFKELVNKLRD